MTNSWHFRGLDSRSGKLQIFKDCKVCLRTSMLYRSYRRIYHAHTEHFAWQVSGLLFFFFKTLQCAWRTFRVSLHHSGAAWVSDIKHVNYQAARRALRTGKWLLLVDSVTQHPQVIWLTEDCLVSHVFFFMWLNCRLMWPGVPLDGNAAILVCDGERDQGRAPKLQLPSYLKNEDVSRRDILQQICPFVSWVSSKKTSFLE